MARARKRHLQQPLMLPAPGRTRRNKKGAGRPRKPGSVPHVAREQFTKLKPAHITLRMVRGYESLRRSDTYEALRAATHAVSKRGDFRIVHLSPEDDHVHLVIEADNDTALSRGIQAFEISAAQRLNRAVSKLRGMRVRGKVFAARYHVRLVGSPTQAHHTINYVLNNWRRHNQDESSIEVRYWDIDYMSSAISFDGWSELAQPGFAYRHHMPMEHRLRVAAPRSWLLRQGWRKVGAISMYAVPGPVQRERRSVRR